MRATASPQLIVLDEQRWVVPNEGSPALLVFHHESSLDPIRGTITKSAGDLLFPTAQWSHIPMGSSQQRPVVRPNSPSFRWPHNLNSVGQDGIFVSAQIENAGQFFGDFPETLEQHLWSNDDSKEKRDQSELWAARSGGQCLFVMPQGVDLGVIGRQFY